MNDIYFYLCTVSEELENAIVRDDVYKLVSLLNFIALFCMSPVRNQK